MSEEPVGKCVTLKEHFTLWINKLEESVDFRFKTADEARALALHALEAELANLRAQVPTAADHEALEGRISVLETSKAYLEGKASQNSVNIATLLGALALIISIVKIVIDVVTSTAK